MSGFRGNNRRGGFNNGMNYGASNGTGALQGHQLTQAAQQHQQANAITIEVRGWQGATKDECVSFLSRKSRIALQNSVVKGDVIVGTVRNMRDADDLVKWSGVRFAGNPLRIEKLSQTSETIDMLKAFLHRRYNAELKMLDLSNIAADPELQQRGAFTSITTQSKMFPALMKLSSQQNFVVETVNLSDNNLQDITGITTLAQTHPNLLNLALSNNRINNFRSLESWKNKFRSLRELVLAGNPICTNPDYKNVISKIFPRLVILDGIVIRDENKLKALYELPVLRKQFFFEDAEIQQISTQFVSNFLQCWDNDRTQLLPLYTPESQFSISADLSAPNDAAATDVAFGHYLPISRNLTRVSSERTREQRLGKGPEQIAKLFQQLPKTKHKLDTDPSAYSMEAWRYNQVNGVIITLHGEFQETAAPPPEPGFRGHKRGAPTTSSSSKLTSKSFDRTFVVVPTATSMIIASDLLIVRPIATHKAWDETSAVTAQVNGTQTPPPSAPRASAVPLPDNLTPVQKEIVTKLMMETKLNVQFTLILAEQSQWNYDAALAGFTQAHQQGQIPPEAFQ